jgi:hypothetical protein
MKIFSPGALLMAFGTATSAMYGTAGCGLGSLLFGNQKGFIQLLAATTNLIEFNQTIAITTGTSNCTEDGVALIDRERALFAEANFEPIKQEIAMGKGENVDVLASLYGCEGASVGAFCLAAKANYAIIGNSSTAPEMLDAIDGLVHSNAVLSTHCGYPTRNGERSSR